MHRVLLVCSLSFSLSACDGMFDDLFKKKEPSEDKNVYKMAVLGDSLAVGLFGDTTMGKRNKRTDEDKFDQILEGVDALSKRGILAGYDIYYKANHENAYSCGTKVESCSFSLAHHLGLKPEEVKSLAVSGAMANTSQAEIKLATQLDGLTADMQHFAINIGGNDFCNSDFNKDEFIAELDKVIKAIYTKRADAKIVVATIPNIPNLFKEVAPDDTEALPSKEGKEKTTCGDVRGNDGGLDLCSRLNADDANLDNLKDELDEVNAAIADLKNTHTKLMVATGVKDIQFNKKHLSADCFHPNTKGLKLLAAELIKAYQ